MTGHTGATLADWLALHDLTPDLCRALVPEPPPHAAGAVADREWHIGADVLWRQIAGVLATCLPAGAADIQATLATTRTDFSTPGRWGNRAFTLHDDGQGNPLVVCPVKGKMSDMMRLAHEFGHAAQIVACRAAAPALPPVLREVCAFVAETRVVTGWPWADPDLGLTAVRLMTGRGARKLATTRAALLGVLHQRATPYDYDWNYPLARRLAAVAVTQMDAADQWRLFRGQVGMAELIAVARR